MYSKVHSFRRINCRKKGIALQVVKLLSIIIPNFKLSFVMGVSTSGGYRMKLKEEKNHKRGFQLDSYWPIIQRYRSTSCKNTAKLLQVGFQIPKAAKIEFNFDIKIKGLFPTSIPTRSLIICLWDLFNSAQFSRISLLCVGMCCVHPLVPKFIPFVSLFVVFCL